MFLRKIKTKCYIENEVNEIQFGDHESFKVSYYKSSR